MKITLGLLALAFALPAYADRLPLPAGTPKAYVVECGSCHLAYPPALMADHDWQNLMRNLESHFGTDATVAPETRRQLESFLVDNAGSARRLGSAGAPPRITRTERFVRKHRKIANHYWQDPRVRSAANCEACHTHAAQGRFSEHDLAIPELRR